MPAAGSGAHAVSNPKPPTSQHQASAASNSHQLPPRKTQAHIATQAIPEFSIPYNTHRVLFLLSPSTGETPKSSFFAQLADTTPTDNQKPYTLFIDPDIQQLRLLRPVAEGSLKTTPHSLNVPESAHTAYQRAIAASQACIDTSKSKSTQEDAPATTSYLLSAPNRRVPAASRQTTITTPRQACYNSFRLEPISFGEKLIGFFTTLALLALIPSVYSEATKTMYSSGFSGSYDRRFTIASSSFMISSALFLTLLLLCCVNRAHRSYSAVQSARLAPRLTPAQPTTPNTSRTAEPSTPLSASNSNQSLSDAEEGRLPAHSVNGDTNDCISLLIKKTTLDLLCK